MEDTVWVHQRHQLEDKGTPERRRSRVFPPEQQCQKAVEHVGGGRLAGMYPGGDEKHLMRFVWRGGD
jgi:hypothetical protein